MKKIFALLAIFFAVSAPVSSPAQAAPRELLPEFRVPPGGVLRERVDFWIQIYGRLSTSEGVIHDSRHPTVIYSEYDFRKFKQPRRAVVKREKERIREILLKLHRLGVGSDFSKAKGLTDPEEKRIALLFKDIEGPSRFLDASHYRRLRFQLGQKNQFLEGVKVSGEYLPFMEEVFIKRGLPFELTRLPFVESSFNTKARSKVGASGIWQFMRTTGARFLTVGDAVDERNDPIRATEAAASLLAQNHETLGNWPLAVTAYNHGRSSLLRATNRLGTHDLEQIILRNHIRGFGFASSNFFACLVAALEVERNPEKYFGKVDRARPHRYYEVELPNSILLKDLVSFMKLNRKELIAMNPGFSREAIQSKIRIPSGYRLRIQNDKSSGSRKDQEAKQRVFLSGFSKIPASFKGK